MRTASIKLVLKKNRQMKDGSYPVYLSISYYGRVEKATGVSISERHWNPLKEEVRATCPNYKVLNQTLYNLKSLVTEAKNRFEMNNLHYTPQMLFEAIVEPTVTLKNDLKSLISSLIDEKALKVKTCRSYWYMFSKLKQFVGKDLIIIDTITVAVVKRFSGWLSDNGISDGTIRSVMQCLSSVWNYAIEKDVIDSKQYPFKSFKYQRVLTRSHKEYAIDFDNMMKLKQYWLDMVIDVDGDSWRYKKNAEKKLLKRTSDEFGILFFLMAYHLNGSAPVDVAKLKVDNCERVVVDGIDYWKISFKRQKTGTDVNVMLKRDLFCLVAFEYFLYSSYLRKNYIYPVITNTVRHNCSSDIKNTVETDKQFISSLNRAVAVSTEKVKKAFETINQQTIQSNVDNNENKPLVEIDKITFYVSRHSFATNYLNSPGATVNGLASLLGRSPNTIATYIQQLKDNQEIADAVSFLK